VEGALDFDALVPGAESHVARYDHCKDGSSVELVTMEHVGHFMSRPTQDFTKSKWEFLQAHTRQN
jgi:poly(3-hydroxybutyrate) depolymerase